MIPRKIRDSGQSAVTILIVVVLVLAAIWLLKNI